MTSKPTWKRVQDLEPGEWGYVPSYTLFVHAGKVFIDGNRTIAPSDQSYGKSVEVMDGRGVIYINEFPAATRLYHQNYLMPYDKLAVPVGWRVKWRVWRATVLSRIQGVMT